MICMMEVGTNKYAIWFRTNIDKRGLGGGGAICWTWRLFQSSYLNAGKMQVHDTGRVKTETQDQEKQDQQGPVRERANVAVRSADSGIFPHAFLLMVS